MPTPLYRWQARVAVTSPSGRRRRDRELRVTASTAAAAERAALAMVRRAVGAGPALRVTLLVEQGEVAVELVAVFDRAEAQGQRRLPLGGRW